MESAESDVDYFEANVVFSGESFSRWIC